MTDMINHPPHYKDDSGIECIDIKEHLSSTAGDCFKYLYRCGNKDAITLELGKAKNGMRSAHSKMVMLYFIQKHLNILKICYCW